MIPWVTITHKNATVRHGGHPVPAPGIVIPQFATHVELEGATMTALGLVSLLLFIPKARFALTL